MARETELAWAAGFIDGEGCISLVKRSNGDGYGYYQANLNVPQIDKAPLLKLQEMFGGSIRAMKQTGNRRPSFVWTIYAKSCRDAVEAMLPYLVVKQKEARLLLSVNFPYARLSQEELQHRENIHLALKDHHKNFVYEGSDSHR